MTNYFLISVSNRENLELCMKYGMAGFTNSINGLWTFLDIGIGDYISFIYGARVRNLYKVVDKVAYKNAELLPPWPPVTFKMSGNTYYFPFRLYLKQERVLDEPMVRPEFAYVAENLLLRGGYRKTHFQADLITLHNVSNMGEPFNGKFEVLSLRADTFVPKLVFEKRKVKNPEKFYFQELILQALIRKKIQKTIFNEVLEYFKLNYDPNEFEILGEKALPEGYVDIFIKLKHPAGSNRYILVEIKTGRAQRKDINQLKTYITELGSETIGGVLIVKDFPKTISSGFSILPVRYYFDNLDVEREYSYIELLNLLRLEVVK